MARFVVALLAVLGASDALACSCGNTTPENVFDESAQVLLVRIVSVEDVRAREPLPQGVHFQVGINYGMRATFESLESFKGDAATLPALNTGYGGGDCGVDLTPGKTYLVNVRAEGVVGSCGIVREVNPTNCAWPVLRDALHARGRDGSTKLDLPQFDALIDGGADCARD